MNEEIAYLLNTWYVAALSSEIGPDDLFHRKIADRSILMYRKQDGEPVAMRDRCPHRFLPLSMGKREGDEVVCHYHGLRFDCSGKCIHSPHGNGKIPQAAVVQSFPLVERDGFLWIWLGEPSLADPSAILDCSRLSTNPTNSTFYFYMHNPANYELISDNIMDLSHIDHLHGPLINTEGKLSPLIPQVTEEGDDINIRWDWKADPAMQLLAMHLDDPGGRAEQFFSVKWHAPANMHLQVGAVQNSDDYHSDGVVLYDFHIMTPETAMTTHYFFASTRNYKQDDAEYNQLHKSGLHDAFTMEDKPVIGAQQVEMGTHDLFSLNPVLLTSDAGNIRVRRKLKAMVEAEQRAAEKTSAAK